jgi:hypothetical protein
MFCLKNLQKIIIRNGDFHVFWKYFESAKFGRVSGELNIVAQFTE